MNMPFSFMQALGGYGGGSRPLTRPPVMTRPYPGQAPGGPQSSTLPYMLPQDQLEQEPLGYLPGGMQAPQMPTEGPDVKPPMAPGDGDGDEMGLGQQFLRALGQTVGRARRGSQGNQPFYVRQRTE